MILSILICSLPERKDMLDSLCSELGKQRDVEIHKNRTVNISPWQMEILVDNNTFTNIGEKRNNLLQHAKGEWVVFVDDDDLLSPDYLSSINKALLSTPNPDCCSMRGIITFDGINARLFEHSIDYKTYYEKSGIYYRPPNHLNVIRCSIAKQFKFPEKNFGEDADWAMQICESGLLKTEAKIDNILYYYKFIQHK